MKRKIPSIVIALLTVGCLIFCFFLLTLSGNFLTDRLERGDYLGNEAWIYIHGDTLLIDNTLGCDTIYYDCPIFNERLWVAPREEMRIYSTQGRPVNISWHWRKRQ